MIFLTWFYYFKLYQSFSLLLATIKRVFYSKLLCLLIKTVWFAEQKWDCKSVYNLFFIRTTLSEHWRWNSSKTMNRKHWGWYYIKYDFLFNYHYCKTGVHLEGRRRPPWPFFQNWKNIPCFIPFLINHDLNFSFQMRF